MNNEYVIGDNANFTSIPEWNPDPLNIVDQSVLDEWDKNSAGYDLYMQKIKELQNIFDLSDIERTFQENQYQQFSVFREKNKMYGKDNISGGDDVDMTDPENIQNALQSLIVRMEDKMNRFKRMVKSNNNGTDDETMIDTLNDLSNYANIALIVKQGKWI